MSKKSRRRNKKILAALALAGGAAMLAKGRKGEISSNRPSGIDAAAATGAVTDVINPNAAKVAAANTGSNFQTKYSRKVGNKWMTPNQIRLGNINPHEATAAAGAAYRPHRVPPGSMRTFKGGGIAKRGMGAAYKRGGRVKSMGIAKRGGGAAKR